MVVADLTDRVPLCDEAPDIIIDYDDPMFQPQQHLTATSSPQVWAWFFLIIVIFLTPVLFFISNPAVYNHIFHNTTTEPCTTRTVTTEVYSAGPIL